MDNIFDGDAFGIVSLTTAINNLKYVPGRIGQMGLFGTEPVNTTSIAIEQKDGVLTLVAPTPRGGPGVTVGDSKRVIRSVVIPHFQIDDTIMADSVQNVRAFGQENVLETVVGKVNGRLAIHNQSFAATEEYARVGAIKGVITYSDGSELDLFDLFGVSAVTEVDFDLDNANPAEGILRRKCAAVVRSIGDEIGGLPFSGVVAQCGDAFFDDLTAHKEIRDTFKNTQQAGELRTGYILTPNQGTLIYSSFTFGGITWENYRGKVGNTTFVNTDKAHFFPVGAPGLFTSFYGPADYEETVNTMGKRLYAKQIPMPNGKGRSLEVQMNALQMCNRPRVLQQARRT